ncbi:MAG: DUF1819 family protein [Lewinellaceae bacterium]|nr:DUF1819 family protein [Saprospiraceae bacterium]MCB9342814.1 DUF1819 family protein [Lewinellaceae bacterium]
MQSKTSSYSSAFTASALLYEEFAKAKQSLLTGDFGQQIKEEVLENTSFGIKSQAARKRISQEMIKRYELAPAGFWSFYFNLEEAEQKLALLFLCLKTYTLMFDFHLEVTMKHWKMHAAELERFDLQMRLDEISSAHSDVDAWSESTKTKTITVYLRTLTEAGLLKAGKLQKPNNISSGFRDYFMKIGEAWFLEACFI